MAAEDTALREHNTTQDGRGMEVRSRNGGLAPKGRPSHEQGNLEGPKQPTLQPLCRRLIGPVKTLPKVTKRKTALFHNFHGNMARVNEWYTPDILCVTRYRSCSPGKLIYPVI